LLLRFGELFYQYLHPVSSPSIFTYEHHYLTTTPLLALFWPAKTLPPRGAGWEPGRLAFQS